MRKLLVGILTLMLAGSARAGMYYSNDISSSSGTLRVAGVLNVAPAAAPYAYSIRLNGTDGKINANDGVFVYGLTAATASISGSLTASSGTFGTSGVLSAGPVILSTIGDKLRFDNVRRWIKIDPPGTNPMTFSQHVGAGSGFLFGLDNDDAGTDSMTTLVNMTPTGTGIGTASPARKLEIYDTTNVRARVTTSGAGADASYESYDGTTLTAAGSLGGTGCGNTNWSVYNGACRLNVANNGNVGVGHITPATTLDVNGNAQFGSGATKSTFTATGFWEPYSRTRAQIDLLVPTKVGQVIYASDTTLPGLCVSTGTAAAQWRKMESATLGCGTNN